MKLLKTIFQNKVVLYVTSRYVTYFLQFITSLILASNLGPYYLGVWGFYQLVVSYLTFVNFGIPNSLNIMLIKSKNDPLLFQRRINESFVLISILGILILIFSLFFYFTEGLREPKIEIGTKIKFICAVAIVIHYNSLFSVIYRIKNRLFEMALQQSITPLLIFICAVLFKGERAVYWLLWGYLLGEGVALFVFIMRKQVCLSFDVSLAGMCEILKKGLFLFLYNTGFYFILLTTRTLISSNYSVEDFGYFTFSYTIANSILLLLQAFSAVIFPKIVDKYSTDDKEQVHYVSNMLMNSSVTLSYGLIFCAIPCIPLLLKFLPQYENTLNVIVLTSLTVLLYTNSIYSSYLMAQNKERKLAVVSVVALAVNIIGALVLIKIFTVPYSYVVLSMMLAYFVFDYLITFFSKKNLKESSSFINTINSFFPLRLMIPFLLEVLLVALNCQWYMYLITLLVFVGLNHKEIRIIIDILKTILVRPQIIDINQ